MIGSDRLEAAEAAALLDEAERIRQRTRRAKRSIWFPLVLFGAIAALSATVCTIGLGPTFANSLYWSVAGPVGYGLTWWYYRRRERDRGVGEEVRPFVIVGVALVLLSVGFVLGFAGRLLADLFFGAGPLTASPPHGRILAYEVTYRVLATAGLAAAASASIGWMRGRARWAITWAVGAVVLLAPATGLFPPNLFFDPWIAVATGLAAGAVGVAAVRLGRRGIALAAAFVAGYMVLTGVLTAAVGDRAWVLRLPALPFLIGRILIPSAAPVAALAAGLLVLAWLERSAMLAVIAAVVGVAAVLSGLSIIDNRFGVSGHCSPDQLALGGFMVLCGAGAWLAERRGGER